MKILAYNINSCTQSKVDQLFIKKSDIYVIPEIAQNIKLPEGYSMEWIGNYPSKGLGIIYNIDASVPEYYDCSLPYAIPLLYEDLFIVAFWPTKVEKNESYTKIAKRILTHYSAELKNHKSLITGDFNLYHKKDSQNKDADLLEIDDLLQSFGLKSVYHKLSGEAFGNETKQTYFHQFKEELPFFLDYTYTNFPVKSYTLLSWDAKFSDHVGQIIEI
jgi:hypothetical protein